VIVAVFVTGDDAEDALSKHGFEGMRSPGCRVDQTRRHATRVTPSSVKLPDRQQPGVGGDLPRRWPNHDWQLGMKIKTQLIDSLLQLLGSLLVIDYNSLRIHRRPPCHELTCCR
jgi:hypothetical protein